jgi:integrase
MPRKQRGEYGQGSVWYDKKEKQWWAQLPRGKGQGYERVRAPRSNNTKEQAEQILAEMRRKKSAGVFKQGKPLTVQQWLSLWYTERSQGGLKPKTLEGYEEKIRRYILPYLGHIRIDMLDVVDVRLWITELREDLSDSTVRNTYRILNAAFKQALQDEKIEKNHVASVSPPKVRIQEAIALSPEQIHTLLHAAEGHRLAALYHTVLTLGLRKGEVLGLRWSDLDWKNATLKVRQQVQTVRGKTQTETPKTDAGMRTLPIPPLLLARLRAHWEYQQTERLKPDWHEHGVVFPSEVGTFLIPRNLIRHYHGILERVGLAGVRFHDLRHTCMSLLDYVGATEAVGGAILGHSKRNVTQWYTHANARRMREAVEAIEGIIQGTNNQQNNEQRR